MNRMITFARLSKQRDGRHANGLSSLLRRPRAQRRYRARVRARRLRPHQPLRPSLTCPIKPEQILRNHVSYVTGAVSSALLRQKRTSRHHGS